MLGILAAALLADPSAGQTSCEGLTHLISTVLATMRVCVVENAVRVDEVLTRENAGRLHKGRWSGLSIDLATLKLSEEPVAAGGELLRVKVRQGFTARLTRQFQGNGLGGPKAPVGALVYGLSRRLSITEQSGRGPARETAMSGSVYLWCVTGAGRSAAASDRSMCFVDKREKNTVRIGLLGPGLNLDNQYTFVMSKPGEAALAPNTLEMAATMGIRKPTTEPANEPYPQTADLILGWKLVNGQTVLTITVADGGGQSRAPDMPFRAGGPTLAVFGGELALTAVDGGLRAAFVKPPVDGAIVGFEPDSTGA